MSLDDGTLPSRIPEEQRKPPVNLDGERDRVVRILSEGFSRNLLSLEEFESRVAHAEKSGSTEELEYLVRDLPALEEVRESARPAVPALSDRPVRYVGIMSERTHRGDWLQSSKNEVRCIMSSQLFDFRETAIPPEGVEIDAKVIMAEMVIIVPPGVDVRLEAVPIMGEAREDRAIRKARYPRGTPCVRITGVAIMGSIHVKCRE